MQRGGSGRARSPGPTCCGTASGAGCARRSLAVGDGALDVLADALGDVSRSAVGNVIRETLPLLRHEGHIPGQAPARYRTAADLLAAAAPSGTPAS